MNTPPSVEVHELESGALVPNSPFPLLVYRGAFDLAPAPEDPAQLVEDAFQRNGWTGTWRDGVYDFDHFHSTAHEALGCYRGRGRVRFGGAEGVEIELEAGDVVIIPAGVAHQRVAADDAFAVVGAYADGRAYDIVRADAPDLATVARNLAQVPRPTQDPVYGERGPLSKRW